MTLVAGAVLFAAHWLLAVLAFYIDWFGPFVRGEPALLIKNCQFQEDGIRRGGTSMEDLTQSLRQPIKQSDPTKIELPIASVMAKSTSSLTEKRRMCWMYQSKTA